MHREDQSVTSTNPTRGSRVSASSGGGTASRNPRRHVHARAGGGSAALLIPSATATATATHPRTGSDDSAGSLLPVTSASGPSAASPAARSTAVLNNASHDDSDDAPDRSTSSTSTTTKARDAPRTLHAYQEVPPRRVSPPPTAALATAAAAQGKPGTVPTPAPAGAKTASSVSAAAQAAAAARLTNPDAQRRIVTAGSSNPLHVWGHETTFLRSRYFNSKRRKEHDPHSSNEPGDEAEEGWTAARTTDGTSGGASSPLEKESKLRIFPASTTSSQQSRGWRRYSDDSSGEPFGKGDEEDEQCSRIVSADAAQASLTSGGGGGGGGRRRGGGGGPGDALASTSDTSDSGPLWKPGALPSTFATASQCRTRNMNALRAYSWDQRVFLPQRHGGVSPAFGLLASPRFWEKLDWTIRGAVLTILPTMILCLEPTTKHIFPMPTSVVFLAYWTTQPTFGAGLRETYVVLKGFTISLVFLCIVVAIQPGPKWLTLIIMFIALVIGAFLAEQMKRMMAYCFASLLMQYVSHPDTTGFKYIGDYYTTLLIGQGFGLASFIFPYIRWSSENARRYLVTMGDAISLSVHGACCSFWVETSLLERQLHAARLRQLRQTIEASMKKAVQALSEMGYEPHSGVYTTRLKTRMSFLKNVFNIIQSMTLVIEQIASTPALIETPMCRAFGERIRGELAVAAAAMDAMLLRIVDLDELVSEADFEAFSAAKTRYEDAVSSVRDEVILSNENYHTDNSDILLGFFLFSVEELMEAISGFKDAAHNPSNLWHFLTFPLRDLQSSWLAFVELYHAIKLRHSITRRLKEAIKLSICIAAAAFFQVYAMKSASTSPVAGVDIIAFVYRPTGGDSFQYAQGRLLGTVLGSLTGLLGVQIANGRRGVLYGCALVLTFIAAYVQASPDYGALGSAMANSVISISLQYRNTNTALTRIQQNCFAILIYFVMSSLIWPVRGRTKVKAGFDMSLRMAREATDRLLRNLDLPHSATAVSSDVLALIGEMQKKVGQQLAHIPGAKAEPTMDSAEFPEMPWRMLVGAQRKLAITLLMMRHAYLTFMTSTIGESSPETSASAQANGGEVAAVATSISVHWVVLHRISPYTRQLSELFYEAMEVYLLLMSKVTFVPTAELTRLRLGMMQCYDRIVAVYIETIQHELRDDGASSDRDMSDDGEEHESSHHHHSDAGEDGSAGRRGSHGVAAYVDGDDTLPIGAASFAALPGATHLAMSFAATTPSGLLIHNTSMVGGNPSFSGTGGALDRTARRSLAKGKATTSQSGLSESAGSNPTPAPGPKRGTGHFSYKLTPEERQRLREYVLGPGNLSQPNASFFAAAGALAANEASAAALLTSQSALPTTTGFGGGGGMSFTNASMFNLNGTFFNRNASMFDPALLRNAGIAVAAPVHEEPRMAGRSTSAEDGDGDSASRWPLHRVFRGGGGGVHGSAGGGDGGGAVDADSLVIDNRSGSEVVDGARTGAGGAAAGGLAAAVGPAAVTTDTSATSPAEHGEHKLAESPQPLLVGDAEPSGLHSQAAQSRPAPSERVEEQETLNGGGFLVHARTVFDATSSPPLVARRPCVSAPSLLQQSIVLPVGVSLNDADAVARLVESQEMGHAYTDITAAEPGALSISAPHTSARAAPAAQGSGESDGGVLLSNTSFFMSDNAAAAARVAGGDVFLLGRAARPTLWGAHTWGMRDVTRALHHDPTVGTASDEVGERGSMGRAGRGAGGGGAFTADAHEFSSQGSTSPGHEPFEEGHPSFTAGEPEREGRAARSAERHVGFPCLPESDAEGGGDGGGRSASAGTAVSGDTEEEREGGSRIGHHSSTAAPLFTNNASFTATGPAIPEALRAYVEGLAAHQQQQAPPPPALLGNVSFVHLSNNLPALSNRSFLRGGAFPVPGHGTEPAERSMADPASSSIPPPAASTSVSAGAAESGPTSHAASLSAVANAFAAASRGEAGRGASVLSSSFAPFRGLADHEGSGRAGTQRPPSAAAAAAAVTNATSAGGGELRNMTFFDAFRSFAGTQSFNPALMRLLQPEGESGDGDGEGGEDFGDEYVLTNSDIHSLEAFLFGLRALITQVEEMERHLLEVVHGTEMAKKL